MSDAVDLALFRGALEQLKAYCLDCDTCPIRDTCHAELTHTALWGFADRALDEMMSKAGFSAKEAVE